MNTNEPTPLLFILVGHAGSGKSSFARQLAEKRNLVRLNGDSFRTALFESVDAIKEADPKLKLEGVFKAIDYVAKQVLVTGQSVIYDANNNKGIVRENLERMAKEVGALPIVIWIKAPKEEAIQRVQAREATVDQRQLDENHAREVVERHIADFDEPSSEEKVIEIDGTVPWETQFTAFNEQLKKYIDD